MSLDDLLNISVSANTASPSKAGYGRILIACQKVPVTFTQRTKLYSKPADLISDGFSVSDPAYLAASAIAAQNPKPVDFKIGKRVHQPTQTLQLTCTSAIAGDIYSFTLNATPISYTVPSSGSPTTTTVATAIAALCAAVSGASGSTSSTSHVSIPAVPPALNNVKAWTPNLQFADLTADAGGASGIVDDLTAIANFDNDWYGLVLDSMSSSEVEAAAPWVEGNKKFFVPSTSDYAAKQTGGTDVLTQLKAGTYQRTSCWFKQDQVLNYFGAGLMAKQFAAAQPGSDSYAYKTVAGQVADVLSPAERSALVGKNGNIYETLNNVSITEGGMMAGGQWMDVVRGLDWMQTEMQFRIYTALLNNPKIPYTDLGVDSILSIINAVLKAAVTVGLLVAGSTSSTAPLVADIDPATKQSRQLTGVTFTGELQGAIQGLVVNGTVTA